MERTIFPRYSVRIYHNLSIDDLLKSYDKAKKGEYDKTEITRPIQECTEQDLKKLCKFWNEYVEEYRIAILTSILDKFNYKYNFCDNTDTYWMHCRRLTKQEIKELC